MSAHASLLPELEEVIRHGSSERRATTLRRITTLFLDGAGRFNDDHLGVFDLVFSRLIPSAEVKARTELSHRLAPLATAPAEAVRRLAHDDDIAVAGPVLVQSRQLAETDLVTIARTQSEAHLFAIAGRGRIAEAVTDVLVRRGARDVAHRVADNLGARLSERGFFTLVDRAKSDSLLAEKVGLRPDIPPRLFRDLLLKATEVVQQRLVSAARPETQAEIRRVLAKVSDELGAQVAARDYSAAQRAIEALRREGKLDEASLVDFAKTGKYDETVAALACLCAVPIDVVDRLMRGERPDPILILCKSAGWGWPTAKAIIMARSTGRAPSSQGLDNAYSNFERLSSATAQRVMRFWQVRRPDDR
jgi:uncharacterized protein (DUF2336 family)